jgi:putative transposase
MPKPPPLQPGRYYHICNRGNNRENIFLEERNYPYFLKLYAHYVELVADTFAYCLLRNHFHLLVRIKAPEEQEETRRVSETLRVCKDASQQFGDFFNAYAKAINKAYGRTGSLFQHPFGRIEVTSDAYFVQLVTYIHQNPQKHGFVTDFRDWSYSSYHTLLVAKPTRLKRDEVLAWFGGIDNLAAVHRQEVVHRQIAALTPEDFD